MSVVTDLVEAQSTATPDAIAIAEGYKQLTYRELDGRANQLAHLLRDLGVGPDVPVALCMRRSTDLVIGALGILRASGAYVPLDPDYPANRLSMLLSDSGARVVVTHPSASRQLPSGNWRTVVLDAVGTAAARYPRIAPQVKAKPEDLAYVIFTSGSTGRPKGVQVTHAILMNLVRWHQRAFSVLPSDRATLQASPGFDAAVWEIWPYLAAGATIYLVDEAVRTTPDALRDWLVTNRITISFFPTALAQQLLELQWPEETALRVLLTGADTLHRYPSAGLPFAFVNNYGPTECTVVTTSGAVPSGNCSGELPTIGKPIDNAQVYVVNEELQPVPLGTPGELLIGGAGVARGYLNLPELSAQKFIPDPFSQDPTARLYKTGDLVRYLPNGEIAFMGRIDDQIKIRGYRIEPQEITAVLNNHPHVEASIVVANGDGSGEKRLVAYLVPAAEGQLEAPVLRSFLGEHLPDYMVPSTFVRLEKLPISASGKVDRAALPLPTPENTLEEEIYEAPQTEIQERLANIVAPLLGVSRVGIDDNFFNLGGHSLLGAQMIARISDTFGVELSLLTVFNDPTVRGMSAEIERLIIEKVSAMSEEEAQSLLASSQDGL
ncbi:MAG: amino acid adenylation domain-containing protein [Candidatus Sulfotelmatobacter sp.]